MNLILRKCMNWSYVQQKFNASMQKYEYTFNHMIPDCHLRTHWERKKISMLCLKKAEFLPKAAYRPVHTKSEAEKQSELLAVHLHVVSFHSLINTKLSTHQRKIVLFWCQINWFNMNRSKRYALFLFKIFFALNIHENICV